MTDISDFLSTPAGQIVLDWEMREASRLLEDVFGFSALQLGLPQLDLLRGNRIPLHVLALSEREPDAPSFPARFRAEFTSLPLATESQDLVVLPHTLDFAGNDEAARQTLREAARVLMPEGRILLTAFNPVGLWNIRQKLHRGGIGSAFLPEAARPIRLARIRDWFSLLGLEIDRGEFGAYEAPARTLSGMRSCHWMNAAGDRWWPSLGNIAMISACKHIAGACLTGLEAFSSPKRIRAGGVVPVAETGLRRNRARE